MIRRLRLPEWFFDTKLGAVVAMALSYAPTVSGRGTRVELGWTLLETVAAGFVLGGVSHLHHDRLSILSALWLSTLLAAPIGSAVIRRIHDHNRPGMLIINLFNPIGIFIMIPLLLSPGRKTPNNYGRSPYE